MKTLFSGLILMIVVVGCDQSTSADRAGGTDMFSEESMLTYATTGDDDPALTQPMGGMHNGPRHGRMLRHLADYLDLTEDQQDDLRSLGESMFGDLSDIRDQVQAGDLSRDDARTLIHDLREQFMTDVRTLLTEDQQTKLDEWEARRWQMKPHRGPRRHSGG